METINQVLKVLFQETRSDDIMDKVLRNSEPFSPFHSLVDEDIFARQLLHVDVAKTIDQAEVIYHVFSDEWARPNEKDYDLRYSKETNLFNILLHFSSNKLYLYSLGPVCRYEKLLSWHEITRDFGEDLLVTSFLAAHDLRSGYERKHFDWKCYLPTDSKELNAIFSRDMYDVHAHLGGSSLNFEINWLCLMNVLGGHENEFRYFDAKKVYPSMSYKLQYSNRPLYVKVLCAAAIRLYLFLDCFSEDWAGEIMAKLHIVNLLRSHSLIEAQFHSGVVQEYIDVMGYSKARKFYDEESDTKSVPDYAIMGKDNSLFAVLGGERRLMYQLFHKIYSGAYSDSKNTALFYIYLLVKEEVRREMVQMNSSLGFANFGEYQDRKSKFIEDNSIYDRLLPKMAIHLFKDDSRKQRYMEARVAPKKTAKADAIYMQWNDACIMDKVYDKQNIIHPENYGYIFHFIKFKDTSYNKRICDFSYVLTPRHSSLRETVACQAKAIRQLVESNHDISKRIVGIDAANSEIFCRPEVFAQSFRYLSLPITCNQTEGEIQRLGMTFHVGEDFYDIIDGMRAVDEVLKFFHFSNGARLGHALALGTDVHRYYQEHAYRVNAPKQVLLDNAAWLYVQAERLGCCSQILSYLREVYSVYFHQVYSMQKKLPDIFTYYQSWLLRGDSPEYYQTKGVPNANRTSNEMLDDWFRVALNYGKAIEDARNNSEAYELYYLYHFNIEVRKHGAESEVMRIKPEFRKILLDTIYGVQQSLLAEVERLHIAIECNPSSNYKIGEMKRYDEHPILKFNNRGLDMPHPSHAISVSINTDDAGVFATSLEREYSLMALALEKHNDSDHPNSPRQIMDWLESVRLMSKEQVFKTQF